jgi:hypothetical protein
MARSVIGWFAMMEVPILDMPRHPEPVLASGREDIGYSFARLHVEYTVYGGTSKGLLDVMPMNIAAGKHSENYRRSSRNL